jgi:flagellar basal-body rod protein FlgB
VSRQRVPFRTLSSDETPMSEISDASVLSSLRQQMTTAVARQVVAAGNLANVDTPGYRAREIDFDRTLDSRLGGSLPLSATNPAHLGSGSAPSSATERDADGLTPRRDGNTVQLDRELLAMTEAAGDFAKAQTALSAKFRLLRYAINEGQ